MKFTRTRPCAKCPFRVDVPGYLTRARAIEIQRALLEGETFTCHETVTYDEDETGEPIDVHTGREVHCAGALVAQTVTVGPGQVARITERIGEVDLSPFDVDPREVGIVALYEFPDHHEALDTDLEFCNIVGPECENPAGYSAGGGAIENPDGPTVDTYCFECGEPCCLSCMTNGRCQNCAEWSMA